MSRIFPLQTGPFIDSAHPLIVRGEVDELPAAMFRHRIASKLTSLVAAPLGPVGPGFPAQVIGTSAAVRQSGMPEMFDALMYAARRELMEEAGTARATLLRESDRWRAYDLPPKIAATSWGGRYKGPTQLWYLFRFDGTDADIDLLTHGEPEFAEWRWLDEAAIMTSIVPFKRPIYQDVFDEFRADLG